MDRNKIEDSRMRKPPTFEPISWVDKEKKLRYFRHRSGCISIYAYDLDVAEECKHR